MQPNVPDDMPLSDLSCAKSQQQFILKALSQELSFHSMGMIEALLV
jgi:hypothetical protein